MTNQDKGQQPTFYTIIPDGWAGAGQLRLFPPSAREQALREAKPGDQVLAIPAPPEVTRPR